MQRFLTGNVLDSRPIQATMLADEVLNFWVRDGTRCDHFSIVTGSREFVLSKLNNTQTISVFLQISYDKILDLLVSVNSTYHYAYISDLSTS